MKKQIYALSPEQLAKVLKLAKEKSSRDHAMMLTQYFHGLRVSELVSLRLSKPVSHPQDEPLTYLDRRKQTWFIVAERAKGSLETRQNIWDVKGKPIWNEKHALQNYIDEHRGNPPSDYVFISKKTDGPLDPAVWNRLYKGYVLGAGLPVTLSHNHCLKHSRAKHLLLAGNSLEHVRQSLGHASLNSTAIYVQVSDQEASEAAKDALDLLP